MFFVQYKKSVKYLPTSCWRFLEKSHELFDRNISKYININVILIPTVLLHSNESPFSTAEFLTYEATNLQSNKSQIV